VALALSAPSGTASAEGHADWLELRALLADDGSSSLTDLIRALRPTGTIEEVLEEQVGGGGASPAELSDPGDEMSEAVAESAASELDDREVACGGAAETGGAYPFVRGPQYLQCSSDAARSVYVFLLLLSTQGIRAGPSGLSVTELFEDIAAVAAESYFGGGAHPVDVYQFGFPRRRAVSGFMAAINELCTLMGEGGGARKRPNSHQQKDAKLDLVVWRSFPDARTGKIVAFGQCAAGRDWREKLSEMQPSAFTGSWMTDRLGIDPMRLFFCPFRVERDQWETTVLSSGLLFDRCRIALHCADLDTDLADKCQQFSEHVLGRELAHA
jgi:hypothetical protein